MIIKDLIENYKYTDTQNKIKMTELLVHVPVDYVIDDIYIDGKLFVTKENFLENADKLYKKGNEIRNDYGKPLKINRGFSTPERNTIIGGAKFSNHIRFCAIDFNDIGNVLYNWFEQNNEEKAKKHNIWLENKMKTKTWCHVQIKEYASFIDKKTRFFS